MPDQPTVVVVGSVHMDLIAHADRLPGPGESVTGGTFAMAAGGKAANQATQLARLGLTTYLVSRLGDDLFGRELRSTLSSSGVRTEFVAVDPALPTGASTVFAVRGDYSSIIAPGAAGALSDADILAAESVIARAPTLILQLELPVERAVFAAELAHRLGVSVVVNASPAPDAITPPLDALLTRTSLLAVNRVELARLAENDGEPIRAAEMLRERYAIERVVVTLGAEGALIVGPDGAWEQPAFPAEVVDAVGAGDAFLGALVAGLTRGRSVPETMRTAAAAGALAVSRQGGQASLPDRTEIDDYLARNTATALTRRVAF